MPEICFGSSTRVDAPARESGWTSGQSISNGFYAATKRKAEANGGNHEPMLAATTKSLGDSQIHELVADPDAPWHEYCGRGPITKNRVAAFAERL